jgi:hypothetical protein
MIPFDREDRTIVVLAVLTLVLVAFGLPHVILYILVIAMGWAFEGANGGEYLTMIVGVGLAWLIPTGTTVRALVRSIRATKGRPGREQVRQHPDKGSLALELSLLLIAAIPIGYTGHQFTLRSDPSSNGMTVVMLGILGLAWLVPTGLTVRALLQAVRPPAESAFRVGELAPQGGHIGLTDSEQEGGDVWR